MNYYDFLNEHLTMAFGCTEPVAIAYATSVCKDYCKGEIKSIQLTLSPNIIKNANSVKIPNMKDRVGIKYSALSGLFCDSEKKLEVLDCIDDEKLEKIDKLYQKDIVKIKQKEQFQGVYIEVVIKALNTTKVIILNEHTHIVLIKQDEKIIKQEEVSSKTVRETMDFTFEKIYEFAKTCDISRLKDTLDNEIDTNLRIAIEGVKKEWELNISDIFLKKDNVNLYDLLLAYTSGAADARMSGCSLPVVINAGSGDQGLTVSVPIIIYALNKKLDTEKLYRGLIFGNLLGFYQKEGIGKLSAYCATVTAAAASVCAISFMNEDDIELSKKTLHNALCTISGMICDGAKSSCAAKIAMSLQNALMSYELAKNGKSFQAGDGIAKSDIDSTVKAIGYIAKYGMKQTDTIILDTMLDINH